MKLAFKHAIKGWISTVFAVVILTIVSIKFYCIFDTITVTQAVIVMVFYVFGIYLVFVKDSFLKDVLDKFLTKKIK